MKAFIGRLTWLAAVGFLHCVASEYGVAELGSTICEPNSTPPDNAEPSITVCGNISLQQSLCSEQQLAFTVLGTVINYHNLNLPLSIH